jgi:predicted solute-binding protein
MSKKTDKSHVNELKEMIQESKGKEPVDKIMAMFCHRHGVSMNTCREYYEQLVAKGEIKRE